MLSRLRSVTDALFRRDRFEQTMTDEMRFHMDAYADDLVRSGMSPNEARRRARIEFGGVESLKEECREARGLRFAGELRQDLRYALRQMRRAPGLAAAAILSLALGIGANTAVFSLIDAVLLRALPITRPSELFFLAHGSGDDVSTSANYPLVERYRTADIFTGVAAYSGHTFHVTTADGIERVYGQFVSGNYHAVLGVPMVHGRGFTAESDRDAAGSVLAVISEGYWKRRFGGSTDVLGRTLTVGGRPVTIVGVTASGFHGLFSGSRVDVTLPMSVRALDEPGFLDARDGWISLAILGRLKPGTSAAATGQAVDAVFQQYWMEPENGWARRRPTNPPRSGALLSAARGSQDLRRTYTTPLRVLMGMAAVVLLITCGNVGNLLLARAAARRKEIAVRLSMGASRGRLVRQLLTESLLLAALGGALGLLVAAAGARGILALLHLGPSPILLDVPLSTTLLSFTTAVTLLTGIGFGLVPAFRGTRLDLTAALKQAGTAVVRGRRSFGRTLVIAQVALCVLVTSVAGLLMRSLNTLRTFDAGFERSNLLLFDIELNEPVHRTEREAAFYTALDDRLRAMPGVRSVALSTRSPIDFSAQTRRIEVPGFPAPAGVSGVSANIVTPEYLSILGIPLVRGRGLTARDRAGTERVAVVSESMAHLYFPDADPLGRTFLLGADQERFTVVGVVGDARHERLRDAPPPTVYSPLAQPAVALDGSTEMPDDLTVTMRVDGNPAGIAALVPAEVRAVRSSTIVSYTRTMRQQIDAALTRERLLATLASGFGGLALLLAAVGLYGVMSYAVTRRSREIALRMALGATRDSTLWRILRESLGMSLAGVVIGLGASLLATGVVATFLFGLSPRDPVTLAAVAAILIATAALAGYLPARRAAAVEPMRALTSE